MSYYEIRLAEPFIDLHNVEIRRDPPPDDGLEICDDCGHEADRDQLHECANSIPVQRGPWHCDDCLPECGPCRDEMARDWNDDHGIQNVRRH